MANANEYMKELFDNVQSSSILTKRSEELQGHVRGFGCPNKDNTSVLQRMAIEHFIGVTVNSGLFYSHF